MPKNETGWFDLPWEVRQEVIQKLDEDSKHIFLTASPEFLLDIPRNYIKKIKFSANELWIYNSDESYFILDFFSFCGASEVCCIRNGITTWKIVEKCPLKVAISTYFQNIVRNAINCRLLMIYSCYFPFETTSIKHLNNIEYLEIQREFPIDLCKCGFIAPEQFPPNTIQNRSRYLENGRGRLKTVITMIRNQRPTNYYAFNLESPLSMKEELFIDDVSDNDE